jgi:hypothetical protein
MNYKIAKTRCTSIPSNSRTTTITEIQVKVEICTAMQSTRYLRKFINFIILEAMVSQ